MKAIKVTQKHKNENPIIFKHCQVGKIYSFNLSSNQFNTFVRDGKTIIGYNFNEEQQAIDGFTEIVKPEYDTKTHKLGELIKHGKKHTYKLLELTPKELDDRIPMTISKLAFKTGLMEMFEIKNSQVNDFINQIPDEIQKETLSIMWNEADFFERKHPVFSQFAGNFGLSIKDIKEIFKNYA